MPTDLSPTPYQARMLAIPECWSIVACGGRGGGKTMGTMFLVLRHIEAYEENARVLIVRRTYKALQLIEEELHRLLLSVYGERAVSYNRAEKLFRLANGATIELGQLDGPTDYSKYHGREITMLVVDEWGEWQDNRLVAQLKSGLRSAHGVPLRTVYTANPGGPLHSFIHREHVARAPAWHPYEREGEVFVNAPSVYLDNPFLDHADYIRRLRSSTSDDAMFKAWSQGDWNIARGAFFADCLDQKIHQLPVAWPYPVTRRWSPFLAMDWGSGSPSVCYVCLQAPGDIGPWPKDTLLLIDEIATVRDGTLNEGLDWPPSKLADAINERCDFWRIPPGGVVDDAKGFDTTLINIFRDHGIHMQRPLKNRVAGWAAMRDRLVATRDRTGAPGLLISARCGYFWQTVPFVERDPKRPEDIITTGPDHAADAARYACMHSLNQGGSGRTIGMY